MPQPRVSFDRGPLPGGTTFQNPVDRITADTPDQVDAAFAAMARAQAGGKWLAGCASYELGYTLCPKLHDLMPGDRGLPLLQFGVFDAPAGPVDLAPEPFTLGHFQAEWSLNDYSRAFQTLHEHIAAGDIYQANLTFPLTAPFTGSVDAIYQHLKQCQPVPHGAFVDLGGPVILSRSPELFFALDALGRLTARPMKGTAPRGATRAADDALRDALKASEKNRAENLMIVDLLRNDMARVSRIGSVRVPELFTVERYDTLHQMTSRITSDLLPGISIRDLFAALFPCGSITGAPKIRAMEILRGLEPAPRDIYCGSIGWIAPDGAMEFNVAIRTLVCFPDGTARLNAGGGVVYDSTAPEEYDEALLKTRFARSDA